MTLHWDIQYLCGICPTQNEQQREPSALSLALSLTARQVAASYCCPSFQFQKHLPPKDYLRSQRERRRWKRLLGHSREKSAMTTGAWSREAACGKTTVPAKMGVCRHGVCMRCGLASDWMPVFVDTVSVCGADWLQTGCLC